MSGSSTRLAPRGVTGTASNAERRLPSPAVSTSGPCSPTSLERGGSGGCCSLVKHMTGVSTSMTRIRLMSDATRPPLPDLKGRPRDGCGEGAGSGVDTLAIKLGGGLDDEVLARRDVVSHEQVEHRLSVL